MYLFSKAKDKANDLFGKKKKVRDLLDHVARGDLDYIKTLDPDIFYDATDEDGNTALLIATKNGYLNVCKEILEKCPHQFFFEKYIFHQAMDSLRSHEIYLFIDLFVSVGLGNLHLPYIVRKFFMYMEDLKGNRDTALFKAVDLGNLLVVKKFLQVDRQYNLDLGPSILAALKLAEKNKNSEMVNLLIDKGDLLYSNFVPYSTAMDLFDCIRRGDLDHIKVIELNVLLNFRDQYGMSVLCIATKWDQLDCCKEILKRCPSLLYHQNNDNWTVLHHAAGDKNDRLIDFFVSVGLEGVKSEGGTDMITFKKWINLQNSSDDTPLVIAVNRRSIDIVERFAELDRQYKLGLSEIVGSNNKTALQWAMHIGCMEITKALVAIQTGNCSSSGVVSKSNSFTFTEVSKHNNLKDCWLLIYGKVYDVTIFLGDHPGGSEVLLKATGKDATTDFKKAHSHSSDAVTMMDKFYVGVCDSITTSLSKLASDKPQPYSQEQLKEFTKDFSQPLGSGGFGDVYKGQFPDGVLIAVKVLKNIEFNEYVMEKQFRAEVDTMGRAYHCNLIKLYGYCYEANTKFKAIVYEYMENGSFDKILFEKKFDIPWAKLYNIAKEIAQGISYLHESCSPQIIHQDIKPSNVLLDSNFSPKVIDFGLARVNNGESQFEQTSIKGSRDYMVPEVNQPEQVKLSCKVDVYSFGKMLFDVLGSKRNHVEKSRFPGQVWEEYKTDQLDKFILDCGIKEEDKENAKRLAIIALLCVEHNPQARPMLSNVVKILEGKIKLHTPIAPFYPNYYSSGSSSMSDSRDH